MDLGLPPVAGHGALLTPLLAQASTVFRAAAEASSQGGSVSRNSVAGCVTAA